MFKRTKQLTTIRSINRHPLGFCDSRQMDVVVVTEDGRDITVPLCQMPYVQTDMHQKVISVTTFDYLWNEACVGSKIFLIHDEDRNYNVLEL